MNKKILFLLLSSFLIITLFVKINFLFDIEILILKIINTILINPILDLFMIFITEFGSVIFFIILFFILFLYRKKVAKNLAISSIILYIIIYFIKFFIARNRPFIDFGWVRNLVISSTDSFPSRHAAQAFLIAYIIDKEFNLKSWKRFIIYFLAVLVSYSRIYLGVHYPLDVIGGVILGLLIAYLTINRENKIT